MITARQADLSNSEGTKKVIRRTLDRFKGVDIIVDNVGGSSAPSGGFMTVTDELWQEAFNEIERESGVIIHISSIQQMLSLYDSTLAYAAAKAAPFHRNRCRHKND